jgi:hypothetical protein
MQELVYKPLFRGGKQLYIESDNFYKKVELYTLLIKKNLYGVSKKSPFSDEKTTLDHTDCRRM